MTVLGDFHTHTVYCDGGETPEAMVRAAIDRGLSAFGLSGHAPMPFETDWCMTREGARAYLAEAARLKGRYAGAITLFAGVEQDAYATEPTDMYDYVIGAAHYIRKNGAYLSVDESAQVQLRDVQAHYGGDYYAYIRDYYAAVAHGAAENRADIVGHFDLVTKFNAGGRLFDEGDRRYTAAALEALTAVMERCRLFEINTGAMYRLGRSVPYPARFLLTAIRERGGDVILSSDSHSADGIAHRFAGAAALASGCGFKYAKTLTAGGFRDIPL